MKIYISGPMTGMPDMNMPAFNAAEDRLVEAGFDVESPSSIKLRDGASYEDYLRAALQMMLMCDGLAMLPGWRKSKGARIEYQVAKALGWPVHSVDGWLMVDDV